MNRAVVSNRHFQYIHDQNTYDEMFTCHPDRLPIGLTSHCKLILDQITELLDDNQRGILFSYRAFSQCHIPYIDRVKTLYRKYDRIHWCDISEREASVDYDLIVLFGTFERIQYEVPLLWRVHIENGSTPVVLYTSKWQEGFNQVDFDEVVAHMRSASHREHPHRVIQETQTPHLVEIDEVMDPLERKFRERNALREKAIDLLEDNSWRKTAEILGISVGALQYLVKQDPYPFLSD